MILNKRENKGRLDLANMLAGIGRSFAGFHIRNFIVA